MITKILSPQRGVVKLVWLPVPNRPHIRPLQVGFLFLVSNFPKSGEGKREIRNLETFLLPVSGQPVTRPTMHTAVH